MTRKEALAELIAKVEAGTDLFPSHFPPLFKGTQWAIRAYEGSLDAAKALHEAVLPDEFVMVAQVAHDPAWQATIWGESLYAETPARAWLLAILKALHSMEAQ